MLPSLLIILLITSSVVAERHQSKNGNKSHTMGTKNNTKEDCDQDGRGIRRCAVYALNDPYRKCYTQFFIGEQAPVGLRTGSANLRTIRYICQPPTVDELKEKTYYATMFDERFGIAVFSAYTLTKRDVKFQKAKFLPLGEWYPTPGIKKQGSKIMYGSQPYTFTCGQGKRRVRYQRGHLVPSNTFSSTLERFLSTYTYTNAVPQHTSFNTGLWSTYEEMIRQYALNICSNKGGTLYLLTGTSFVHVEKNLKASYPKIESLLQNNQNNPGIYIPNSLWTAGCCVNLPNDRVDNFAIIGNNEKVPNMREITLVQLQEILFDGVRARGLNIGGPRVDLFPGNRKCLGQR